MALRFLLGFFESALVPGLLLGERFAFKWLGSENITLRQFFYSHDYVVQSEGNAVPLRTLDSDEWRLTRTNAGNILCSWTHKHG